MIKKQKKGSAWVGIIILLIFITSLGLAIVVDSLNTIVQSSRSARIISAQALCDAGIEKALWRLNENSDYSGREGYVLPTGEIDILVSGDFENKEVYVTAYIPNKESAKTERTVRARLVAIPSDSSISFNYAAQVGEGGLIMRTNSKIDGNVYSNENITGYSNTIITNDAYAVGEISPSPRPRVDGESHPGAEPVPMPDFDPGFWEARANINNDPYIGNYVVSGGNNILGPRKIEGNFVLESNSSMELNGPLHVTGNFTASSNNDIRISEDFGSNGTVILVDGTITLDSNTRIFGTSATPKGHLLMVSRDEGDEAIVLNANTTCGGVFYALDGGTKVNSRTGVVAIAARRLYLEANAELIYEAGLASAIFSGGPGGVWKIREWQIVY